MKLFVSLCLLLGICISKLCAQDVNIVFIGNSITQGALLQNPKVEAPPVQASQYIEQVTKQPITYRNCGISGTTTLDFLPVAERQFPNVKSAAEELSQHKGTLLFSIMLGTNDSACNGPFGSPVEPASYYTNLKAIVDELISLHPKCKIVIHQPIWYSPNTYNGAMYLVAGLTRLKSYTPMIHKLIDHYSQAKPEQVFMGDTTASDFFRDNYQSHFTPENGNAGTFYLHPNKEGAKILGKYWAEAILRIIQRK